MSIEERTPLIDLKDLDHFKKEMWVDLCCAAAIFLLYCTLAWGPELFGVELSSWQKDLFSICSAYGIIALSAFLTILVVYDFIKFHSVIGLKHSEFRGSKCACSERRRPRYMFWMHYVHTKDLPTVKVICPHCKEIVAKIAAQ